MITMNTRNKRIIAAILCVVTLTGGYFTSDARHHGFRGGSVEDVTNRIKQAVETARQGDIAARYKDITEFHKKIMKQLDDIKGVKKDIEGVIGQALGVKKYTMGFLNRDKIVRDVQDLYTISWDDISRKGLEAEKERVAEIRRKEREQAIRAATDASRKAELATEKAQDIVAMKTSGVLGERQKIAMLQAMSAAVKNQNTMAANQQFAMKLAEEAEESNADALAVPALASNKFTLPPKSDYKTREELKAGRLQLPR